MNVRIAAICALLVSLFFGAANPASAAPNPGDSPVVKAQLVSDDRTLTCVEAPCFNPSNLGAGNNSVGKVNFKRTFATVNTVCVTFGFQGNLLDPGEEIDIKFDALAPTLGAGNATPWAMSSRLVCTSSPDITALFKDGSQAFNSWEFTSGSVRLASISFQLS